MFVNTVEPASDMCQPLPEAKEQAGWKDNPEVTDCGFKGSQFYRVIRYPMMFLYICGINVPPCCVCEKRATTRKKCSSESIHQEEPNSENYVVDSKARVGYRWTKVAKANLAIHRRCRNSDSRLLSWAKKTSFVLMVIFHITDYIRYFFILKMAASETNLLIFTLSYLSFLSSQFYLRMLNWYAGLKNMRSFFSAALEYEKQYGFSRHMDILLRRGKTLFCLGLCFQLVQCLCISSASVYFYSDKTRLLLWPFNYSDWTVRVYICIFFAFCAFFITSIRYGSHFLKVVIVSVLANEFRSLHEELSLTIDALTSPAGEKKFSSCMEKMKSLSSLMDKAHDVIKHTVAATYIFGIPSSGFILYGLISGAVQMDQYITLAWFAFEATSLICHTTITLARLQAQARAVVDVVYAADWDVFPQQVLQKATLFTNMFCSKSFGISMYGMFVVDWSTLLMVGGTYATYAVVILQFQYGTPTPVCHCDCSTQVF